MLKRLLLVAVAVIALTSAPQIAFADDPQEELGSQTVAAALDPTTNTANVTGNQIRAGSEPDQTPHIPGQSDPIANININPTPRPPKPTHPFDNRCVEWTSLDECLRLTPKDAQPAEDGSTPATPSFSITDLASFAPAPATLTGEPNNLGVAGLPTNFTTTATTHTRNGTLFGYPLTARFTSTTFTFHYGDTTTRTTTTGGTTWEDLHLPQFTPTDTSHTYTERGTYTAHADTTYTAEIDLGTGWIPITGTLTIPGPTQNIRIYEAHTALVAHTCTETPTAPGC